MTTPSEVLEQALQVASGSRVERARAGVAALRMFLDLSPRDQRDLAVLVAQRAAPELVPRIRAGGGAELSEEQSRAVLDMIRRLDGDDLDELEAAVRTPEARRAALATVGGAAAAATGLDDVVTATGPSGPDRPPADRAASGAEPVDAALARHRAELESRLQEMEAELATVRATARGAQEARRRAEAARDEARREGQERSRELEAEAARLRRDAEQADERHQREVANLRQRLRAAARPGRGGDAGSRAVSAAATAPAETAVESATDDELGRDDGDVARLAARVGEGSAGQALRIVTAAVDRLVTAGPAERRRVLAAIPDGWARRRALQRLVEAGAVTTAEVDLVAMLGRRGDRVFAAGTMLDHGVATLTQLATHLDGASLTRLERREAS